MTTRERTHGKQSRVSRDPIPLFFLSITAVGASLLRIHDPSTRRLPRKLPQLQTPWPPVPLLILDQSFSHKTPSLRPSGNASYHRAPPPKQHKPSPGIRSAVLANTEGSRTYSDLFSSCLTSGVSFEQLCRDQRGASDDQQRVVGLCMNIFNSDLETVQEGGSRGLDRRGKVEKEVIIDNALAGHGEGSVAHRLRAPENRIS
jgi:hypothetical protein